jgi:hypothetical protein
MIKLAAAFNDAASSGTFETENFRDFLYSNDVKTASKGTLRWESFAGDECNLIRTINESLKNPVYFFWLTGDGLNSFGGMSLYKGDVFAEGFYYNRSRGVEGNLFPRRAYNLSELQNKQPWFEWDSSTKKFSARLGSPAQRILGHIKNDQGRESVTLYRGTDTTFSNKASALASLNSFTFGNSLGGIFTTPSYETAKGWASPVVLTSIINLKDIYSSMMSVPKSSIKTPGVYVGIEFGYVEIAFLYSAGDENNLFFDNLRAKCVVLEKAKGADSAFAPPCK